MLLLCSFVACVALAPVQKAKSKPFHSAAELSFFKQHLHSRSPIDSSEYFLPATRCKGCHGHDPTQQANVTPDSIDINLFDDWETSMMGMAAYDPFWRAKVSHEILTNPSTAVATQTLCTACHAPMGRFTAIYHHQQQYTFNELLTDSLGLSGVGCGGCHSIGVNGLGSRFSGDIPYDTSKVEFGPFVNPFSGPMILYIGLTPTFSEHVSDGKFCSPCHTLVTKTQDLNGNPTSITMVEQATFHEWENSAYPNQDKTCQSCHMPQITDSVKIANGYLALQPRSPFNQHQFVGGNAFMVSLIKQHKNQIGVNASDTQFDSTITETKAMLQHKALALQLTQEAATNDTAYFMVKLTNKAGHKFPSGYPSRRAVLQFVVTKDNGDTLFQSGMFDANRYVQNEADVEPHHNAINQQTQSQIYELVMGDVQGNRTTVLERAAIALKDNRIPPNGFTSTHPSYDTMKVVGTANDNDFNKTSTGTEGSGTDEVHYRIALKGYTGHVNVTASVYYQSVPPKWLQPMFALSSTFIDSFKQMYNDADKTPVLVARDTMQHVQVWNSTQLVTHAAPEINVYPNPTMDGKIMLTSNMRIGSILVVNAEGEAVDAVLTINATSAEVVLPLAAGVYYLRVNTSGKTVWKKILRL